MNKPRTIESMAGFTIVFMPRFGGVDLTLGLPILIEYPMIQNGEVLFPFRTLAMASGLITIIVVSRLTQKLDPAKVLKVAD